MNFKVFLQDNGEVSLLAHAKNGRKTVAFGTRFTPDGNNREPWAQNIQIVGNGLTSRLDAIQNRAKYRGGD